MNRDAFGIPVELRNEMERERVRPIALAARERKEAHCKCKRCEQVDMLDAVLGAIGQRPVETND